MALRKIQSDMVSNLADLDFNTATLYSNLSVFGEIISTNIRWITGANIEASSITTLNHLNVSGNATIAGNLSALGNITYIDTNVVVTSAMTITNTGTGPALIVNQTGAQPIAEFRDDGVTSLFIADGGNVGIKTNTPSEPLHVVGNARITGDTTILGSTTITGSTTATGDTTITGNISSFGTEVDYFQGSVLLRRTSQSSDGIRLIPENTGSLGRVISIRTPPTGLTSDRTFTLADGNTTLVAGTMAALEQSNQFSESNSFGATQLFFATNNPAINIGGTTTVNDGIALSGRSTGSNSNRVLLIPETLTSSRTLILPNSDGTVATTQYVNNYVFTQSFAQILIFS